jgi:hypothetical protein
LTVSFDMATRRSRYEAKDEQENLDHHLHHEKQVQGGPLKPISENTAGLPVVNTHSFLLIFIISAILEKNNIERCAVVHDTDDHMVLSLC